MAGGGANVDPRFDPQFQRGYDPAKHARRTPAPRVEERSGLQRARLETPTPQPEPTAPPRGAPRLEPVPDAPADDDLEPRRRNPFRLVLLLASIAAIAGAAALLWKKVTTDPYYYGNPQDDYWALFSDAFLIALLPALVTAGLLGLMFWLALGVLRRRDHD